MISVALFWLFFFAAIAIIVMAGKRLERCFAGMMIFLVSTTYFLNAELGWDRAQIYVLLIDSITLILSLFLVSIAKTYWPIWFSAFHAIAVATGIAQFAFPNEVPAFYTNMQGFWFFPAIVAMVIGVMLDSRERRQQIHPSFTLL